MEHMHSNFDVHGNEHQFSIGGNTSLPIDNGHNNLDLGGSISGNHGHYGGSISGGWTTHPTDNSSFGFHGQYDSHGGYNVGIGGSINW
jgi:hypothetical protein